MKRTSAVRLGMAFAGSFLGAGFVSGQELWQFFGRFGAGALPGLILAMTLIGALGYATMELARRTGITEMDRLVVQRDIPLLRRAMSALQTVMLFGFIVIMCAGAAALCAQQWSIPAAVGGALFAAAVAAVSLLGVAGLVDVFSALVPLLSAAAVLAGAMAVLRNGFAVPQAEGSAGGWAWSAVVFFAYNLFGVVGILIPLGQMPEDAKANRRAAVLGSGLLTAIAAGVLLAMNAVSGSAETEMPILVVMESFHPWLAALYAALLLAVMFGASLACMVALMTFLQEKAAVFRTRRTLCAAGIMAAALIGSFAGFSQLIGIIYPIFGYCGIGFLILLALHWKNVRKGNNAE